MIDRYSLEWETLDVERHDVESFLFAKNEQIFRQYLVEQAYRDQANGVKRTRLLVYEGELLGFYTSCCSKLKVDHSEAQNVNGRGDDLFVPALEIAYLAVDVKYRRESSYLRRISRPRLGYNPIIFGKTYS